MKHLHCYSGLAEVYTSVAMFCFTVHILICLRNVFAAKYDVAISTACPGLDYIVVETTAAAQACVELLRRQNLGVATFMILVDCWS